MDGTSNLLEVVDTFVKKYNKLLNDSECHSSFIVKDPKSCLAPVKL